MNSKIIYILVALGFLCSFFCSQYTEAAQSRIAVVHSYHASFGWVQEVNRGITAFLDGKELFNRKPKGLMQRSVFDYYYMDGKNHQTDRAFLAEEGRGIIVKLKSNQPDLVIICDDEALEFVAKPLMNDNRFKFVFLGVNNDPRSYGITKTLEHPDKNMTGLISEHPFYYSIKLLQQIVGKFDRIHVLFDDSTSGKGIMKDLKRSLARLEPDALKKEQLHFVISNDWNLWKKIILSNQSPGNIFVFGTFYTLKNDKGTTLTTQELADWITKRSKVPELTILSSHISEGFLVSISNPGFVHGYEALAMGESVLEGKKISDIPIYAPGEKALHVNPHRAKQLRLKIPLEILTMAKQFERFGY